MNTVALIAELARRPRDGLAVVARARGDHAGRALLVAERRELVDGAADLERARALQVLGLQQDPPARPPRERVGAVDRRHARVAGDALARGLDVSERRCSSSVANAKHLLENLTNRRQRVEPACLHVVQEPPQLGIVLDRVLQVTSCPRRGDLEHLLCEVRADAAARALPRPRATPGARRSSPRACRRPRRARPRSGRSAASTLRSARARAPGAPRSASSSRAGGPSC